MGNEWEKSLDALGVCACVLVHVCEFVCVCGSEKREQEKKKRLKQRRDEGGLSRAKRSCVMADGPCA